MDSRAVVSRFPTTFTRSMRLDTAWLRARRHSSDHTSPGGEEENQGMEKGAVTMRTVRETCRVMQVCHFMQAAWIMEK